MNVKEELLGANNLRRFNIFQNVVINQNYILSSNGLSLDNIRTDKLKV